MVRRTHFIFAAAVALWSLPVASQAQVDDAGPKAMRQLLEKLGVPADEANRFVEVLGKVEDADDFDALVPWLSNKNEAIPMMAGGAMMEIDPEQAEKRLIREAKKAKDPNPKLLLILGMSRRKESIDFLVQRLQSKSADERTNAGFALQVRTGGSSREPKEWAAWWKSNRATFNKRPVADLGEFLNRLRAVNAMQVLDQLSQKPEGKIGGLEKFLQSMAAGVAQDFSDEALAAMKLFSAGELDVAIEAYRRALTVDQFDRTSQMDCAFLLLETERFEESAEAFQRLDRLMPGSVLIEEFRRLAEAKIAEADRLEALLKAIETRKVAESYDLLNDPLLMFLLARGMAPVGIRISPDKLEQIMGDSGASLERQLGACLASRRDFTSAFGVFLRGRFPDSAVAQAWVFAVTSAAGKTMQSEAEAALERWLALEPGNTAPAILKLGWAAKQIKRSHKDPGFLRGEKLAALEAALALPKCDFHFDEAKQAVAQVVAELRFPLPASAAMPQDYLNPLLNEFGFGFYLSETERKDATARPEIERLLAALDLLLARLEEQPFTKRGMPMVVLKSSRLSLRKALLQPDDPPEKAAEIKEASDRLRKEDVAAVGDPRKILIYFPLPSLQRTLLQKNQP